MSNLIPSMSLEELKKLDGAEIAKLKAVEITSDGAHLFTAIIPHGDYTAMDYIKTKAEYLAMKANISGGIDPNESPVDPYPYLTKAREARKAKREAKLAVV